MTDINMDTKKKIDNCGELSIIIDDKTLSTIVNLQNNNNNTLMMNSTNDSMMNNNNNHKKLNPSITDSQISIISDDKFYNNKKAKNMINHNNNNINEKNNQNRPLSKISLSSSHNLISIPINKQSHLPLNIILGIIQLLLSITLVPVGCLIFARESTLSNAGAGIWSGAIAGITGALGIINIGKAQTGFLAMNLICVASSTLAMAITCIGVVRDSSITNQEDEEAKQAGVSASGGLLFVLIIHFLISVFSVYFTTFKICTRPVNDEQQENVMANSSILSQRKVEEYIKSISYAQQNMYHNPTIISNEKFPKNMNKKSSWAGVDNMSTFTYPGPGHLPQYPVMLVPAGPNKMQFMPVYGSSLLMPPNRLQSPDYNMRFNQRTTHKNVKRQKSIKEKSKERKRRRKSEGDLNIREALTYTGLDRAIAESFLVHQEKNNIINDKKDNHNKYMTSDVAL